MDATFSQLSVLGSSLVLLLGLILLWRRGVPAYVERLRAGSRIVLAGVTAVVAHYGGRRDLYWVAGLLLLVKGVAIPWLLRRMDARFAGGARARAVREHGTSLVVAGCSCSSATASRARWWR